MSQNSIKDLIASHKISIDRVGTLIGLWISFMMIALTFALWKPDIFHDYQPFAASLLTGLSAILAALIAFNGQSKNANITEKIHQDRIQTERLSAMELIYFTSKHTNQRYESYSKYLKSLNETQINVSNIFVYNDHAIDAINKTSLNISIMPKKYKGLIPCRQVRLLWHCLA